MAKKPIGQDPDFEEGEHEGDVYDEEGREELLEDDDLKDYEEGFVEGYEHGEHEARCATCGIVLSDKQEGIIEEEINGEYYRFCSEECAEAFEVGKTRKRGR